MTASELARTQPPSMYVAVRFPGVGWTAYLPTDWPLGFEDMVLNSIREALDAMGVEYIESLEAALAVLGSREG